MKNKKVSQVSWKTAAILWLVIAVLLISYAAFSLDNRENTRKSADNPVAADIYVGVNMQPYHAEWTGEWQVVGGPPMMIMYYADHYAGTAEEYSVAFSIADGYDFAHAIITIGEHIWATILVYEGDCLFDPNFDSIRLCR